MTDKVAIVYWCDGAGHAARAIPVAKEFESRGIEVAMAGGGQGKPFVEMNGFDQPDLTTVTVKGDGPVDFLRHTAFDLIPSAVRRTQELSAWLDAEDPDLLVTDDVFAGLCAARKGIEFYRIDHLTTDLFGPVWGTPLAVYNEVSLRFAEGIVVTSLWPDEPAPEGITRVGPLAQEGDPDDLDDPGDPDDPDDPEDAVEPYDVLLSPGTHGENFAAIRDRLEADGLDVRTVGDDDWETKPTMTPYTAAADVVICTGFSSIADTVVAGTPCVIYPFLPFQKAIAEGAAERGIEGVSRATSVGEAVRQAKRFRELDERPEYENGAPAFVDAVVNE